MFTPGSRLVTVTCQAPLDEVKVRVLLLVVLSHQSEPVTGRYVRLYSNGNSTNDLNHYTEVEIWGRSAR